jgi:hypothetical protein
MTKSKKQLGVRYDTDHAAKNIFGMLVRDFRLVEGRDFAHKATAAIAGGISSFRMYQFPELGHVSISRFKRYYQLAKLYKKYRFKNDIYTDEELSMRTQNAYLKNQVRICQCRVRKQTTHLVLQEARKIVKSILGDYDPNWTFEAVKFGKKSSIGCPLSLAYIDHKLTNVRAFTSSSECITWFKEYLKTDPLLSEILKTLLKKTTAKELIHDYLNLVEVPKSWEIDRGITPLTLIALAYSYGVGDQIVEKLAYSAIGINIKKQQHRHRRLIGCYSLTRSHATMDLSAASDSLISELLNAIFPRKWYVAIRKTFIRQIRIGGRQCYTASVLPMGNGLTFPVETLVFYSLIKAIGNLANIRGKRLVYSVYGDDLIYPSKLHKYVSSIFPELGLKINKDKTYVNAHFRESCGADYYYGADVRPAFLPDAIYSATPSQYCAWLYKVYNALTRRWDSCELTWTLRYLISELSIASRGPLLRVPPRFPDESGIKVLDPSTIPDATACWEPVKVTFSSGSRWYKFKYLRRTSERRVVRDVRPYYWQSLSGRMDDKVDDLNWWDTDFSFYHEIPQQDLRWDTIRNMKIRLKNGRIIQKQKKKPCCTSRIDTQKYSLFLVDAPCISKKKHARTGSISDWI